jgi:mitochondrial import inner membrane translocase subunit TIM50
MLSRTLLPLARPTILAPAIRTAIGTAQRRKYAKENRAKANSDRKPLAQTPSSPWQHSDSGPSPAGNQPANQSTADTAEAFAGKSRTSSKHGSPSAESPSNDPPQEDFLEEEAATIDDGPRRPLPDLTQGIPSTLSEELKQTRSRVEEAPASLNITEDPAEPIPSGGGRGGDSLPKNAYISSNERKKNALIKYTYLATLGIFFGSTLYLGRNWESEEEEKKHEDTPSGWGIGLFYGRVKARMASTLNYYSEPAFPKLLPDEESDPALRAPFTLVLSLEDLLVHQEWTRESGWRIAKRPGVDYFIRYLSQYYELVLFTSQPSYIGDSVLRKLDPYRIIRWPLFREATMYDKGEYVKVPTPLIPLSQPLLSLIQI